MGSEIGEGDGSIRQCCDPAWIVDLIPAGQRPEHDGSAAIFQKAKKKRKDIKKKL